MADCPETCDCECTIVIVDPAGTPVEVECTPEETPPDPRCRCELSGSNGATSVSLWASDVGLMYIVVVHGGTTYRGICEGTVCVDGQFTCGGNATLYDEDLNTLTIEIDGAPCCPTDCGACPSAYTVIISSNEPAQTCNNPTKHCDDNDGTYVCPQDAAPVGACAWRSNNPGGSEPIPGFTFCEITCRTGCSGEPARIWQILILHSSGCQHRWYADLAGNDCPPTDEGEWTQASVDPACAATPCTNTNMAIS